MQRSFSRQGKQTLKSPVGTTATVCTICRTAKTAVGQNLHERLDVSFVDHILGLMVNLEPAAHYHAIALAHGFPSCLQRHSGTYDDREIHIIKPRLDFLPTVHTASELRQ